MIITADTTNLNIRVDSQLKRDADVLFQSLGMNTSTALNIFLRQCVRSGGIPFDIRLGGNNEQEAETDLDVNKKLENFLDDEGKLIAFPVKRKMKLYSLIFFAEKFSFGTDYSESEINEIICANSTFNDPATIRREMCGYGFFDRTADCTVYRKCDSQPTASMLGL